ncbi:MAG: DUF3298 domain-containing protein [Saprospiraceae bacterium]|nr:DUF3298 domain-containing protein [Saprospiraceae bacterium]MDZ4702731.1 DUF3298 domain-containing protein [Saprospiraceae bacterium]
MNVLNFRSFVLQLVFIAVATTAMAQSLSPLGKSGSAYFHFEGTIGKIPITMNLMQEPSRYFEQARGAYDFSGSYYYNRTEAPLQIFGYLDEKNNVILTESESSGLEYSGFFIGKTGEDGQFSGVWMSGDSSRTLKFVLKESYPEGTLAFDVSAMVDSLKLKPELEGSPQATFGQSWLLLRKTKNTELDQFVESQLRNGMVGDSLGHLYRHVPEIFKLLKDDFFARYQEEVDFEAVQGEDVFSMAMWNYEEFTEAEVAYNQNNLLTIGYLSYSYYGGAHGMYATGYVSYDLKNRKRLKLSDVFKPGYEAKMPIFLERALRRQFNLQSDQSLNEILFDDSIGLTDNFGLTRKGIYFNYVPYEIASYAAGEIKLYVPFAEIADLLQPTFFAR